MDITKTTDFGRPRPATRKEAAEFLRCSERKIDRLIRDGKIKAAYCGRQVLIDASSLAAVVDPI